MMPCFKYIPLTAILEKNINPYNYKNYGEKMAKKLIGKITHYFPKISVAVVELVGTLNAEDTIEIEGRETFQQKVESMQIEHSNVDQAKKGEAIGLKVVQEVRKGDKVYRI